MAERTFREIKKIEENIQLVLQVVRNEIETLLIIKEHTMNDGSNATSDMLIQDELEESVSSIEELMDLHKNLESQLDQLEVLMQDIRLIKV